MALAYTYEKIPLPNKKYSPTKEPIVAALEFGRGNSDIDVPTGKLSDHVGSWNRDFKPASTNLGHPGDFDRFERAQRAAKKRTKR